MNRDMALLTLTRLLRVGVFMHCLLLTARLDAAAARSEPGSLVRLDQSSSREALVFRNGDLLYGALESITPQSEIRWRHPDAEDLIQLRPENVAEIHFPPRQTGRPEGAAALCRLMLYQGDELEGDIVQFDQEKVVLRTWYASEFSIDRKHIRSIIPVPPEGAVVFEGPSGLEGWTIGKVTSALGDAGEWKYKNGAFYATNAASIARIVNIPDTARVEFDLTWKGVFQLAVAIYTDYLQPINLANKDTEPDFAGFYSLQLNSFSANLLPVKKNDPLRYLGQVSVPTFNQKNTAHVEIRASKPKRTVALYVDGNLVKQWLDTEEFAGQGRGVRFVHQGQGKVKMSGLRISEWDGQNEETVVPLASGQQDVAKLRNGDKVIGSMDLIQDGQVTISTAATKLVIPLARVKQLDFGGVSTQKPALDDSVNVRAIFNRGGVVSLRLLKCEDGKVYGAHSAFGDLAFDTAAFARLELKLKANAP